MARNTLTPIVLRRRWAAVVVSIALVIVVARLLAAWPWQIDFLLAVAVSLMWAYRFER
jgi:hypothetical protein